MTVSRGEGAEYMDTQVIPKVAQVITGPEKIEDKAVVLLSGGMDSTTLLYDVMDRGYETYAISFSYGQRHQKELEWALATCSKLGLPFRCLNIGEFGKIAPSVLTRQGSIPKGSYGLEGMKQTVVPNRNMVLLALATSYAIGIGATTVWFGIHGGDHALYPDCRGVFVGAMKMAIGLCDWNEVELHAPYLNWNKERILRRGLELRVDYSLTWSCYEGGDIACGLCGTCLERRGAFKEVGIEDPIRYKE